MGSRRVIAGGILVVTVGAVALARPAHSEDRATDETIQPQLRQSHDVMKGQRGRIHAALEGFLTGDLAQVEQAGSEIARGMRSVTQLFPPPEGKEADQWEAMSGIVKSAEQMEQAAREKKYALAYQHFAAMTQRCVQCHQVRREWGKLPVPARSDSRSAPPKGEEPVNPTAPPDGKQ